MNSAGTLFYFMGRHSDPLVAAIRELRKAKRAQCKAIATANQKARAERKALLQTRREARLAHELHDQEEMSLKHSHPNLDPGQIDSLKQRFPRITPELIARYASIFTEYRGLKHDLAARERGSSPEDIAAVRVGATAGSSLDRLNGYGHARGDERRPNRATPEPDTAPDIEGVSDDLAETATDAPDLPDGEDAP